LTDNYSDEEFAPIAAAMKELPQFAPSPQFADKVMARVRIPGAVPVVQRPPMPVRRPAPGDGMSIDRRSPALVPQVDLRRSVPARIAAAALVASASVTVAAITLVTLFNFDLFLFVSRVFGPSTMSFLTAMVADFSATATTTASGAVASAGTAAGAAIIGSFAAGALATTAALRAAASASRKAA
jgi:hypothetical protein